MKKLALMIVCLLPFVSFAMKTPSAHAIETMKEQCAKEKDPVKRLYSCDFLDKNSRLQNGSSLPEFHKEIVTA